MVSWNACTVLLLLMGCSGAAVRLPSGVRLQRTFSKTDPVSALQDYCVIQARLYGPVVDHLSAKESVLNACCSICLGIGSCSIGLSTVRDMPG